MELSHSWSKEVPAELRARYDYVETRNATAVFKASHPELFLDMLRVLELFTIDVDRIVRGGGAKHLIPMELDEAFRELGWREARYEQELVTRLVLNPYRQAGEFEKEIRSTTNEYGGHQIDNVKGRIGLDVEWNPKDGNLDRDLSNFRALYDGGAIDIGILVVRKEEGMRQLWIDTIAAARSVDIPESSVRWLERLRKTPIDPLGTSTTSNFEKLVPRIERGDSGGCPILAVAITDRCYSAPSDFEDVIRRLAMREEQEIFPTRLAQRMGLI